MTDAERRLHFYLLACARYHGREVTAAQLCEGAMMTFDHVVAAARSAGASADLLPACEVAVRALAEELARAEEAPGLSRERRGRLRCPVRDQGERCVRDEGHENAHVGECGHEWVWGFYCRIGAAPGALAVCERLEDHEGPCRPRLWVAASDVASPAASVTKPAARGLCVCGAPRREHDKAGLGGCASTGCTKYRQAFQRQRGATA
jgi:hypothetical protein